MTDYINRNGLFVPTQDRLEAFRERHGIPEPDKEAEKKALAALKDNIGLAIIAEAKKVEHLFGAPEQGAGALQAAMIAAIDGSAEGLAAYNGVASAVNLLKLVAARIASKLEDVPNAH